MPVSKAQQKAVNGYISRNYDRINLTIPKGRKADVEAHAKALGESVNGLLNNYLRSILNMSEEEWKRTTEE